MPQPPASGGPPPCSRFAGRSRAYAAARPGYPPAAISTVVADLAPGAAAVDLGCGTGIAARQLAAAGLSVTGVEPEPSMRQAAIDSGVRCLDGTAEAIPLPDRSVDLATAFQSFHWFEPHAAIAEIARILRPGGRVALVWNLRESSDPAVRAYEEILRSAAGHPIAAEAIGRLESLLQQSGGFEGVERFAFPNPHRLHRAAWIARAESASYFPAGEAADDSRRRLHAAFDRLACGGVVTLAQRCVAIVAKRSLLPAPRAEPVP
jgi:SAM-dependent methyltransferase